MAKKKLDLSIFEQAAKELGLDFSAESVEDTIPEVEDKYEEERRRVHEADGVLKSLHYPHSLMMKKCGWCEQPFQTNYCYVGFCSVNCRKRQFESHYKIKWTNNGRPFGEYEEPTIISADALNQLYTWATNLIADYDRLAAIVEEKENPPKPTLQRVSIGADGHTVVEVIPQSESLPTEEHPGFDEPLEPILDPPLPASQNYEALPDTPVSRPKESPAAQATSLDLPDALDFGFDFDPFG